jgi:transcriptional regulator with XRE-family HTH domain
MRLGKRIREHYLERSLSTRRLATAAAMLVSDLSRFEDGHDVRSYEELKMLAKALNTAIDDKTHSPRTTDRESGEDRQNASERTSSLLLGHCSSVCDLSYADRTANK